MEINTLIDLFRKVRKRYRFTPIEQAIYFELLAIYKDEETEVFQVSNDDLCLSVNIGEKTLIRARTSLVKAKLVFYQSGKNKRDIGKYSFKNSITKTTVKTTAQMTAYLPTVNASLSNISLQNKPHSKQFIPPTIEDVEAYCLERNNGLNPQNFIDYYAANGWMRGKNKIKDWRACIRTWEHNNKANEKNRTDNTKPKDYTKGF